VLILLMQLAFAQDFQGVIDGENVSADEFPNAVSLGADFFGSKQSICSASIIAPRVALAAAHCTEELFAQFGGGPQVSQFFAQVGRIFVGANVSSAEGLEVTGYEAHEGYVVGELPPKRDVEVIFLAEDAPVQPVPFNLVELTDDIIGTEVLSVGYGVTETDGRGGGSGSGRKRLARMVVSDLKNFFVETSLDDNPSGATICSGDSGGPQYRTLSNGRLEQIAIHSYVQGNPFDPNPPCNDISASYRTDRVADWILDRVEQEHGSRDLCELAGLYDDGVCDDTCAEDPDCKGRGGGEGCACDGGGAAPTGLLALVGALIGLRRRR
jgi:secreted trypsin-like serine protease